MSHDPTSKKCKCCGRGIGAGAYCSTCRRARRATGMYRGKNTSRVTRGRRGGIGYALTDAGRAAVTQIAANGDYYAKSETTSGVQA